MRTFFAAFSRISWPAAFRSRGTHTRTVGRFGRILSVVAIVMLASCELAGAAGPNGSGGPSGDPPITINAGWYATSIAVPPAFFWGSGPQPFANLDGEGSPIPFTFSSGTDTILRITDDFCRGDQFKVFDGTIEPVVIGTTLFVPTVPCSGTGQDEQGPAAAFLDPTYSSGAFRLPAGSHAITIQVITSPFFGGRGYIRIDSPVPPVAFSDTYTTDINTALTVSAPGVLANDTFDQITSPATYQTTAVKVSGPFHGTATLNPDGSFTYTPNTGFTGVDTFTYQLNSPFFPDSHPQATVSIKVNDPGAQTASVKSVNSTCDITLNLTFNPATTDTFVIRPTDFLKHWNCRLFNVDTGQEIQPNSLHGAPGTTIQISGNPPDGDLFLIPAGQTATFDARGNLCQLFHVTDGNYRAECTAENSITDPTANADGSPCTGTECLSAPIRTYVEPVSPFFFTSTGGVISTPGGDQCPGLPGNAGGTGCPAAVQILVTRNKTPLPLAVVRLFDRSSPSFLQWTNGDKNPPSSKYPQIYENRQGEIALCVTDSSGRCTVGLPTSSAPILYIVKALNPTVYFGLPGSSSDFPAGSVVGTKTLNIK